MAAQPEIELIKEKNAYPPHLVVAITAKVPLPRLVKTTAMMFPREGTHLGENQLPSGKKFQGNGKLFPGNVRKNIPR